jgi:hypothetical protein
VLLYTLSTSSESAQAKQLLSTYTDVRAFYLDMDQSGQAMLIEQALNALAGQTTTVIPYVFVCGRYIGGE